MHQNYREVTKEDHPWQKKKKRDSEEEEEGQGMWNKKSIIWELEYWELLDVHHSIDNIDIKKNVYESMCVTLLQ